MSIILKQRNIVLVGNFQPAYFDKYFFVKNDIFKDTDFIQSPIPVNEGTSQIITKEFHILASPNQIILNPRKIDDFGEPLLYSVMARIIECSEKIDITAMGFNFNWNLRDETKSIQQLSKELFYNSNAKIINQYFVNDDAKYGLYTSQDFKDSRLKLDIKPISVTQISVKEGTANQLVHDAIQFQFNFHFDLNLGTDNRQHTVSRLKEYNEYKDYCIKIIETYK